MLSVERCRELLLPESENITDERIKEIRDSLYGLVELALDSYFEEKDNEPE